MLSMDNRCPHMDTQDSRALDALRGEGSRAFNDHARTVIFALKCPHNAQVEEKRAQMYRQSELERGAEALEKICG